MIRSLVNKITGLIAERSHSPRRKCEAPIKIWFEPLNLAGIHISSAQGVYMSGETVDVSKTGVAFMVSQIRMKENYLVGQERVLNIEIDLPGGKVRMRVVGRRYEREGIHLSDERYLVGAEILEMDKPDRDIYNQFLRYGGKRRGSTAPSLAQGGN
jgi:hypothetical protein